MRLYDRFILTLAVVFGLTTAGLALIGQARFETYFAAYVVEYHGVSLLFARIHRTARRLSTVGYLLLAGFLVLMAFKVAGILFTGLDAR